MHTPGPWFVGGDGYERLRADGSPWRSLNVWAGDRETGKDLEQVAEACIPMGGSWTHEEAQANARLIAASPDLLVACRELIRHFCGSTDTHKPEANKWFNFAISAIAKTKGRTP